MQQTKIKINGLYGTWGVIETKQYENRTLVLLEHEYFGDETAFIIAEVETSQGLIENRTNFIVVKKDAWNGFDDLDYELENGKTIGELILSHFTDNLGE